MSIIQTLFGSKPAQQATQQGTPQPGPQPNGQPNGHVQNNPLVPNGTNTPATSATGEPQNGQSPTDNFKDLWSTSPSQQGNQAPNFQLAPEQLNQVASKMNFMNGISQDSVAKVAAGGQEAVQALGEILNTFGQNVFKNSAQFSTHLTEAGYNTAQRSIGTTLPTLVTKQLASNELYQTNPQLRNPAIAPVVEALQAQLQSKHPNATPAEINSQVQQYMQQLSGAFVKPTEASIATGPDTGDFSSFLQ